MDKDDAPVGRVLARREVLALLGGSSAALLAGYLMPGWAHRALAATHSAPQTASTASQSCIARPELTEGPFFVDEKLDRSDIRLNPAKKAPSAGVPLELAIHVSQIGDACAALSGATVDIWHCDALGLYSDVESDGTLGQKFLRGYQTTNEQGIVRFTTIFPGWYEGRAVHIHFKIRAPHEGKTREFTSQFFFDDALTDKIHAQQPYIQKGQRTLRNNRDGIFQQGDQGLILALAPTRTGYKAKFEIGLDLSKASSQSGRGPGGPGDFGGPGGPPRRGDDSPHDNIWGL